MWVSSWKLSYFVMKLFFWKQLAVLDFSLSLGCFCFWNKWFLVHGKVFRCGKIISFHLHSKTFENIWCSSQKCAQALIHVRSHIFQVGHCWILKAHFLVCNYSLILFLANLCPGLQQSLGLSHFERRKISHSFYRKICRIHSFKNEF